MKSIEFLYFYLMPETPQNGHSFTRSGSGTSAREIGDRSTGGKGASWSGEGTKTTEEKQALLGKYLNNVEDLVEDLRESAPFGAGGR